MATTAAFEAEHVHAVYDEIAADFSRTRHSRWPFVQRFLDALEPPGALVLDAGTGNGKYLGCRSVLEWQGRRDSPPHPRKGKAKAVDDDPQHGEVRADLMPIGFDMSTGLLAIASQRGHEVVRGDCVDLSCWRRGAFDHAISIATIHHFATPERRCEAVKQMILAVLPSDPPSSAPSTSSTSSSSASTSRSSSRPPSRLLIVVWSLEQDPNLVADDRSARRRTNGKKGAVPVEVPRLGGRGAAGAEGKDSSVEVEMAALSLQEGQDSVPKRSTTEDREDDDDKDDKDEDEPAQDVFVPWARQNQISKAEKAAATKSANPASSGGPSRADPRSTCGDSASRPPPAATPAASSAAVSSIPTEFDSAPTFNRYYHLFRHYELSNLVRSAALQLGLAFSAPESYPLPEVDFVAPSSSDDDDDGRGRRAVNERDGWEAKVRLCEERWERENWVVEVEVGWERSAQ